MTVKLRSLLIMLCKYYSYYLTSGVKSVINVFKNQKKLLPAAPLSHVVATAGSATEFYTEWLS